MKDRTRLVKRGVVCPRDTFAGKANVTLRVALPSIALPSSKRKEERYHFDGSV